MKPTIGIVTNTLSPDLWGFDENKFAKHLNFKKGADPYLTVFVDRWVFEADRFESKYKVALLAEPSVIEAGVAIWIKQNYDKFDAILTFQKEYCEISPKFKYCPLWIRHRLLNNSQSECRKVMKFYDKNKMTSAIFSNKYISEGHKMRFAIRSEFQDEVDIYGRDHNFIEHKIEGIKDYRYHICVETTKESICSMLVTDAVLCGTVPIYWGNKNSNINEFFNMDGIIMFETISELENILENVVSEEDYSQRLAAMKDNFNKAKDLNMHDLWWKYCIKDFFNGEAE
mgnify:FL=1